MTLGRCSRPERRGIATVELACVLPMLLFVTLATIDFSRVVRALTIVNNAARNGALYLSDPNGSAAKTYASASQAVGADASADLGATPTVTTASGTDANGNAYVEVTVTHTFRTLVTYPGIPSSTVLSRTFRMLVTP